MQSINLSRRFYCSRHHQTEVPPCPHWWRNGPRPFSPCFAFSCDKRSDSFQNVEASWNFKCSGTRSISICISLRPLDSMSNMCTSYVLEVCKAAWKGYDLQSDCSHPRSVPSRCSRDQASSSDLGHVCTKRSFGSLEFLARHTAPEKCLACGMFKVENYHVCSPFSQEVCWGGFSGCIGSRAQLHEFTQIWQLILSDLLTWLNATAPITAPLQGHWKDGPPLLPGRLPWRREPWRPAA